jgi:cardiolipin synthase A/B
MRDPIIQNHGVHLNKRKPETGAPRLFTEPGVLRETMHAAIESARRRVWIETFILGPDSIAQEFVKRAAEAAGRGCDVRVMVDHLGSPIAGMGQYAPIEEAGGHVLLYNPLPPWRKYGARTGSFMHRDHRKILIADDVGFTGGHNLSSAYLSDDPSYHDTSVRVEGRLASELAAIFEQGFGLAQGITVNQLPQHEHLNGAQAQDMRRGLSGPEETLSRIIREATDRCYLTLAYFVPPEWLTEAMIRSARRGVDVRILTAGKTDVPIAREAGRHIYDALLDGGVRIFEYRPKRLHAKTAVVDTRISLIGSFDFNTISRRHSLEVTVTSDDTQLAGELERNFHSNLAHSREIVPDEWHSRGGFERAVETLCHRLFTRIALSHGAHLDAP